VALDLVNRCDIHDYEGDAVSVDDQILDYSRSAKAIVATNDRELRQRATAQGLPVLYMRSKKRLDLDGSLI
jgi:rRNA-processing protein FCF1